MFKIYLTQSKKAQTAAVRCRINKMAITEKQLPYNACSFMVFSRTSNINEIPENAIHSFTENFGKGIVYFYTTEDICNKCFNDIGGWDMNTVKEYESVERKIWRNYEAGDVYSYTIEHLDNVDNVWEFDHTYYNLYGAHELFNEIKLELDRYHDIIICTDESNKYDFNNVEMYPDEF